MLFCFDFGFFEEEEEEEAIKASRVPKDLREEGFRDWIQTTCPKFGSIKFDCCKVKFRVVVQIHATPPRTIDSL